jgi:hypothetical protein
MDDSNCVDCVILSAIARNGLRLPSVGVRYVATWREARRRERVPFEILSPPSLYVEKSRVQSVQMQEIATGDAAFTYVGVQPYPLALSVCTYQLSPPRGPKPADLVLQ